MKRASSIVFKILSSVTVSRIISPFVCILAIVFYTISPIFYANVSALSVGQITQRSIQMSNDTPSATANYLVYYTPSAAETILGIVVDFCSVDPIPGDTCTKPTGFSVSAGAPTVTTPTNITATTWSWANYASGEGVIGTITSGSGAYTSGAIAFNITITTNPSTNNYAFYGRIFDFSTTAGASAYTSTTTPVNPPVDDDGGVALYTTNQIVITSKVQEYIYLCVDNGSTCTADSIALGNSHDVLSASGPYTDITAHYLAQTNASHNATITIQGPILSSGANKIDYNSTISGTCTTNTTCASSYGNAQFGLCSWVVSGADLTIAATYAGASCNTVITGYNDAGSAFFGWNDSASNGIPSPYGDTLATLTSGVLATGEIAFLANISNAILPGLYTTTLNIVATGSF